MIVCDWYQLMFAFWESRWSPSPPRARRGRRNEVIGGYRVSAEKLRSDGVARANEIRDTLASSSVVTADVAGVAKILAVRDSMWNELSERRGSVTHTLHATGMRPQSYSRNRTLWANVNNAGYR